MSRLTERFRETTADFDARATTSSLVERAKDLVEDVIDRVENAVDDRPGARSAASDLRRNSRTGDLASAAVVAVAPAVARTLRDRRARRLAKRRTVAVVLARPVLLGGGLAAATFGGWAIMRLARRLRGRDPEELQERHEAFVESADPQSFELEQEVDRMRGEGNGSANGRDATVATPSPH